MVAVIGSEWARRNKQLSPCESIVWTLWAQVTAICLRGCRSSGGSFIQSAASACDRHGVIGQALCRSLAPVRLWNTLQVRTNKLFPWWSRENWTSVWIAEDEYILRRGECLASHWALFALCALRFPAPSTPSLVLCSGWRMAAVCTSTSSYVFYG